VSPDNCSHALEYIVKHAQEIAVVRRDQPVYVLEEHEVAEVIADIEREAEV
jgi:hypothetical protein